MKKKREKEERIIICPLNEYALADLDYDRAKLSKSIDDLNENILRLEKSALQLDLHDAHQLACFIEVRDTHECATKISQYLGIAKMLLENMRDDLAVIRKKRQEFKQNLILDAARIEQMEKERDRREKEAERIRQKRAADPDIDDIANKKYQRPNKRSDN